MLPSRTLTDLASSLSPSLLIQGAQRIESWRSADSETELTTWFGFSVNGAWTTPYMLQAGRLARAAGVVRIRAARAVYMQAVRRSPFASRLPNAYGRRKTGRKRAFKSTPLCKFVANGARFFTPSAPRT